MNRPLNLILLGAPGAGKGTQAEKISATCGIPQISTGAMIRGAIAQGTEMGKNAEAYIKAGQLVPDEVVIGIVRDRLSQADCQNGFILDGFPRTIPQADALETMGIKISDVLSIDVADERIIARMSGRRVCKSCGATYHITDNPSPNGDKCVCGQPLTIRADDDPQVVINRLQVYHEQTEPLLRYYEAKGILRSVVGQEKLEDTTALTFAALGIEA